MLFMHITRLASNEIFSPSNKIHREVVRAKDLSAPLYMIMIELGLRVTAYPWLGWSFVCE